MERGVRRVKRKRSQASLVSICSPSSHPLSVASLQVTAAWLNYLPLALKLNRAYSESERQWERKGDGEREREWERVGEGEGERMLMKRVSVVTLMQFLSPSLRSLSPALDNELANTLPSPPLGPTCYAQKALNAIFGAPLLIYFLDLVMIIIIVA